MEALRQGSKNVEEAGNKLHLNLLVNGLKRRDVHEEGVEAMLLREPQGMVVNIVADEATSIERSPR